MSQTVSYPIRLVDSSGNALVGLVVSIYPHGAAQIPANVLQTGTTDATGTISPLPSLTSDAVYDFSTNSPQLPDGSFYAADPTEVAVVAGTPGAEGPAGNNGTNGSPGAQGLPGHGSTTTTAAITQPAVGGSFTVPALDGTAFPDFSYLLVSDGTNVVSGQVTSGGGTTALVCTATSVTGAGPIAAGAVVTFTGQTGATGPEGPSGGPQGEAGPAGAAGHGATTTTAAVAIPGAVGAPMMIPLVDSFAFPVLSYGVFTDGTNVVMGQVQGSSGETISINVAYANNYGATLASGAVASFSGVPTPGPQGEVGPAGTPGYGATTTTSAVAMPSVGNGATFPVLSTLAFPIGTLVFLSDGTTSFYGHVSALSSSSETITVVNDQVKSGSPGQTLQSGAVVTFTGGPGVVGPAGHGATTTTATFVAPAVSASASFPVLDAVAFPQYSYLLVTDGTTAFIAQVTSDNTTTETLTVTAQQYVAGAAGATVAEGAVVTFGSLAGANGTAGAAGAPGHGATTTTAAVVAPAIAATVSVPVVDSFAFPQYSFLLLTDGTTALSGEVSGVSGETITIEVASYLAGSSGNTIAQGATVTFYGTGSSSGSGSSTPVADFSVVSSFTPTVGQKYTYIVESLIGSSPPNFLEWGRLANSGGSVDFGVDIQLDNSPFNGRLLSGDGRNSSVGYPTSQNNNGLGTHVLVVEFIVRTGNLVDMRGWTDGLCVGYYGNVSLSGVIGAALAPLNDGTQQPYTSARIYQGYLITEPVTATSASGGSSTTPATYSSVVLADSPSVYYHFAESSGTTATDSSGNGHNGTYVGTVIYGCSSLVHDAGDYSVGLNGAQYVTCPFAPTGSFTVEAVVLATNTNPFGRFFGTDIYSSSTGFIFSLSQNPSTQPPNGFVTTFNTTGSSLANVPVATGLIYANSRMHVALTYDGTTLKIYINGGLAYSATLSGTYKPSANYNVLSIGSDPSGADSLSGFIDEFALYPTALTQARIQAHVAAASL